MNERTTVRLPQDLLARARRKAAAENRTLTALIEDGLRAVVDVRSAQPVNRRRVTLPVSKAKGGLLPGVDLTRLSDYQDMEDLEYAARLKAPSRPE
jgi:hypothetical protein